ncbi:hypothetical protein LSH36_1240g00010 [Paralvinella palmiformis]|uniref:Sperm-associated antigen 16 protein n=1 Tax=Paralvinella palmiformis TaxID=53620 RepID=A0AAD9ITR4_9ANNE|nr:hypothetical protein LSH36_1240g00010 [Paralvinella palmiformis]
MAGQVETDKYYLEKLEEDLELAVKTLEEAAQDEQAATQREVGPKASVTQRPEVVDDFVRNFLVRMGMSKTLDCFQTEWYELQQTGELREEDISIVPDIYIRNQQLDQQIKHLHREVTRFRDAAIKAKETYVKMRKERDFHRMHHKRVVQEKNKLITDIKRLKKHYSSYEPTLRELKQKYETAMKEKMLTKLERDRAIGQVQGLKNTLKSVEHHSSAGFDMYNGYSGPTQRTLELERTKWEGTDVAQITEPRHPNDSAFPADDGINPDLAKVKGPCPHLTRSGGLRLTKSFQAHSLPVSGVALHPRKQILATTSDDGTWKIGTRLATGLCGQTFYGHVHSVNDVTFNMKMSTLSGHEDAVQCLVFDRTGDMLVSGGSDLTARIWS